MTAPKTLPTTGWQLDDFREAYANGASVADVIESVLAGLASAPPGVLIGEPLVEIAKADASWLDAVGPGELPLFGVPIVVKDNIDVAGAPTTAACPGFAYLAAADATVVARLRAAGAVIVAKANMDQFATGLVGTRSPYGVPSNVFDPDLVPGGSSSGSAVLVALGLVPAALGTDTAGSGRVPAAMNGVVGVKPTVGRASVAGIVPAMRRFDCPTVFARTVSDAATVARFMSGPDPHDPFSRWGAHRRLGGSVVGAPTGPPLGAGIVAPIWEGFEQALARLEASGATVVRFDPTVLAPFLECGRLLYGSALVAERSAAVGSAVASEISGLDAVVSVIISESGRWTAVDAYRAEYELEALRATCRRAWENFDVLALPTVPRLVTRQEIADSPIDVNEQIGRLTTFANLLDLCALVVPLPTGSGGSMPAPIPSVPPASLQLLAPAWGDELLERVATAFERGRPADAIDLSTVADRSIVVVGAHLSGQPLNHQLTQRRARLVSATSTAPRYRLFALAGTVPPKPGLVRDEVAGAAVEVEVWEFDDESFGSFVRGVPPPLCIGTVELADGTWHKGFLCEPRALDDAVDITSYGGWRAYLASR